LKRNPCKTEFLPENMQVSSLPFTMVYVAASSRLLTCVTHTENPALGVHTVGVLKGTHGRPLYFYLRDYD
jgi:hypothetical protein